MMPKTQSKYIYPITSYTKQPPAIDIIMFLVNFVVWLVRIPKVIKCDKLQIIPAHVSNSYLSVAGAL